MRLASLAQGFLVVYSGVLTVTLALVVFGALRAGKASFTELTVQRLNVVEPDGTLRLVIADKAHFPGTLIKGKEVARPDRVGNGGIIFLDDEGTEIGGQIWGGHKRDEKISAFGHLSFDRYNGDQTFAVDTGESEGKSFTVLAINDSYTGIEKSLEAARRLDGLPPDKRAEAEAQFRKDFPLTQRVALGRDGDQSALLALADPKGRVRILLRVAPDGSPSLELLDDAGKVISRLPEAK